MKLRVIQSKNGIHYIPRQTMKHTIFLRHCSPSREWWIESLRVTDLSAEDESDDVTSNSPFWGDLAT